MDDEDVDNAIDNIDVCDSVFAGMKLCVCLIVLAKERAPATKRIDLILLQNAMRDRLMRR